MLPVRGIVKRHPELTPWRHEELTPSGCPYRKPKTADQGRRIGLIFTLMTDLCRLLWCALIGLFRSRAALEAEILVLRHQLSVLRRKSPTRVSFSNIDRLVFAGLYRVAPGCWTL